MWRILTPLLLVATGCPRGARPDDALEPNDTAAQATPLVLEQTIEARANQGNPDVYALEASGAGTLVFRMDSLGLEDCSAFTLTAPDGATLYEDRHRFCNRVAQEALRAPGVELQLHDVRGYKIGAYVLRVPMGPPGRYLLTIVEQGRVDNALAFSWDYRVTARVE